MAEFYVVDSKGYRHSLFVTEKSYDIESNTSVVEYTYQLKSGSNNGFSSYGIGWEVWINGTRVQSHAQKAGEYTCLKGGKILTFCTGTVTIEHDADGSKSVNCYALFKSMDGASYCPVVGTKPSGTFTLTNIPRGAMWIDDGTSLSRYQCFVDNGESWDLYMPHIDNGTSWDLYS